jgi:glutamine phosphoribosylpyrophosphate amidotransferase
VPGRYDGNPTDKTMAKMAEDLQIDSLRYLSTSDLGHCLHIDSASLCTGCVTGKYPTSWGNKLMRAARRNVREGVSGRTYE